MNILYLNKNNCMDRFTTGNWLSVVLFSIGYLVMGITAFIKLNIKNTENAKDILALLMFIPVREPGRRNRVLPYERDDILRFALRRARNP